MPLFLLEGGLPAKSRTTVMGLAVLLRPSLIARFFALTGVAAGIAVRVPRRV